MKLIVNKIKGATNMKKYLSGFITGTIATVCIFMFIGATNFSLHYAFISKRKFDYFKNEEFKVYFFENFLILQIIVDIKLR